MLQQILTYDSMLLQTIFMVSTVPIFNVLSLRFVIIVAFFGLSLLHLDGPVYVFEEYIYLRYRVLYLAVIFHARNLVYVVIFGQTT